MPNYRPAVRHAHPIRRPFLVFARDDASGSSADAGTQNRILIVEDDYLVGSQMELALSEAGLEPVGLVNTAEEAVEAAVAGRVALVVMDIRLAGRRDGVDAAIELFAKHGIRCVFATAHADPAVRERAKSANPLGWLQKPYSMASLVETVRKALASLRGKPN
jgi:DNA-binding NarL/FixJ family response regulator